MLFRPDPFDVRHPHLHVARRRNARLLGAVALAEPGDLPALAVRSAARRTQPAPRGRLVSFAARAARILFHRHGGPRAA